MVFISCPCGWRAICPQKDKKMSKGQIRFILLRQIGEAVVDTSVTEEELCQAIDHLKGMSVSYEG